MRTEAKAIRESDFFFLRCGRIKSERGAERKNLSPKANGILGDLSYGVFYYIINDIIKRFCRCLEEEGIGAL